jgi:hypothetical protein
MKAYGVTPDQLQAIASELDMVLFNVRTNPNRNPKLVPLTQFQLRPTPTTDEEYRKYGHNGRRVHAINWGGHKAFMDILFNRYPDTKLVCGLVPVRSRGGTFTQWGITYDGLTGYLDNYMRTA